MTGCQGAVCAAVRSHQNRRPAQGHAQHAALNRTTADQGDTIR
jgi:hypothetical protein